MPVTGTHCKITQLDNAEGKELWRAIKRTKSDCWSWIDVAFMLLDIPSVVSVADTGSVTPKALNKIRHLDVLSRRHLLHS